MTLGADTLAAQFHNVRVDVTASSTEKITCDMMIKSVMADLSPAETGGSGLAGVSGVDSLVSDLDNLENSVIRLLEILDTNAEYVEGVLAGKKTGRCCG